MLTSKQRAKLRGMANQLPTLFQIGKNGITPEVVAQVEEALLPKELIKLSVLETAPVFAREAAQQLAEALNADVVQVIGMRFVLYRPNPEDPVIEL